MNQPPILVENVSYTVHGKTLLDQVSFSVDPGETVALLGHNGAGKSTLIDVICGDLRPQSGSARIFGQAFAKMKRRVGIVYDSVPLFPELKVAEILHYFSSLYGLDANGQAELKESLGLLELLPKAFKLLSKGERKRVGLYLAMHHDPDLLILDEPTSDLDPMIREQIWLEVLKKQNKALFYTSHLWEEAARFADKIVFLHQGKVLNAPEAPGYFFSPEFPLGDKKIVVPREKVNGGGEWLDAYPHLAVNGHVHIFAKGDIGQCLQQVSQNTYNFSVVDSTLKDAYEWLIQHPTHG